MPGTPWRARLTALAATTVLVVGACGGAASPTPAPTAAAPTATPAAETPTPPAFTPMAYPETAVDCANPPAGYAGNMSQIKALDATTVEFDLCNPDVAFLSKVAFTSNPIYQKDWLAKAIGDGTFLDQPNGTGPYMVKEWQKGDHITFVTNPDYWGDPAKTPTAVLRWSSEAAQRLTELQAGTVDGIDNVGPDDFKTVEADSTLKLYPRAALNVFYVGMNVLKKPWDNEKVRQAIAIGIDRKRIVDNFYPPGSEVATHFVPCAIPAGCAGPDWPAFDAAKAKQLLAEAGYPNGFDTTISLRDVVRGYLPNPTVIAQDIQAQLKANLGITAKIDVQESTTFLDNTSAGKVDGLFLLGWGADYPDVTNFLDYHFGVGSGQLFGKPFDDIVAALQKGGSTADQAAREAAYAEANTLLAQHVPMVPIAHGGSAMAYKADVEGAHSSPLTSEQLFVMKPDGRDQLVLMQNGEPGSLFCSDETDGEAFRACEQVYQSLYGFKTGSTDTEPVLASACTPNDKLTVWTCTLRSGVKYSDGSILDANDVVTSYAAQWDVANPLHKGRTGAFDYWTALFGGFLNPPPAQ